MQTAEVEAAQQAAQSALMAEMDLVRRQKVALEEHSRRLELQVPWPLAHIEAHHAPASLMSFTRHAFSCAPGSLLITHGLESAGTDLHQTHAYWHDWQRRSLCHSAVAGPAEVVDRAA